MGNSHLPESQQTLHLLKQRLDVADSASTLIFLGDNIYPKGMPTQKNLEKQIDAQHKLQNQIDIQKDFSGFTFFIPGNHDWYSGFDGLREQEKFITNQLGEKSFLPRKGCSIEQLKINETVGLIVIDSQWFLEDWDKHKNINSECEIKTREDFFEEFESLLNKNQNKITLVALHHPIASNGTHGGQTSIRKQLFPFQSSLPLPGIASVINILRKTTGASPQDNQNPIYRSLINRIKTLLEDRENVIFVSGHDHNLEYIEIDNLKQIISGSGSKSEAARAIRPNEFSYGGMGYAVLDVFEDGQSYVKFYVNDKGVEKLVFDHQLTDKRVLDEDYFYESYFPKVQSAQIYPNELTQKSESYEFLFGKHYRHYYSLPIEAPTLNLEDFDESIVPVRSGGGHQSRSLRLETDDGKQYVMRALKKSATRFIQAFAFKDQYVEKEFQNTFTEEFLLDFYTTTNPYYPFVIGELADPIGIYHTNPKLYYVPKQNALGKYNENYGDELYMVEERPMKKFTDHESFGKPDDIISTDDMLLKLQSNEKHEIDEKMLIRARLFDMLIGDWDRHEDQWRWGVFKEDNKTRYRPIPRDRDQVFPKYDGFLINLVMRIPALRHMQSFKEDISNVKWFNMEAYPLDLALIRQSELKDWLEEADYIKNHLTDAEIDDSFRNLPEEVKDEEVVKVKNLLKIRKQHLQTWAEKYYKVLSRTVVLFATDKTDKIVVNRLPKGETQIQMYRIRKSGDELYFEKNYSKKETKSIWIYGLNEADEFYVNGKPHNPILVRLIGGTDLNSYKVENGRRVRIYDYPRRGFDFRETSNAKVYLSNDYEINQYNYEKPKYNRFSLLPSGGYNPDDGLKLGLSGTFTVNNFDRSPYTQRHNLLANYFFATKGWDLTYTGTFVKFIDKWNLELKARFTSPTFTTNFFGFGNETENFQKELGMDYNRVKIQSLGFSPTVYWIGRSNGRIDIKAEIENVLVSRNEGRITENSFEINDPTFNHNYFASAGVKYSFSNYDVISLPTLGSIFEVEANWLTNLGDAKKSFPYFVGSFGITHRITNSGSLTFSSLVKGKVILNNNFEFFQAAAIGGDSDVRAYRIGRFIGGQSFYQSSDLRLQIGQTKKNFLPMKYGIIVGYDYGRVWMDEEKSDKWHQSIGGGIWLNGINTLTGKINYFHGGDGGRISFGVNFGF